MLSTAQADPTPWLPLPEAADWLEGDAPAGTERANNYYRARYYDPKIGRFISEDPIGFAGGDINLFGYVWNNPVNLVDPLGLWGVGVLGSAQGEAGIISGLAGQVGVGGGVFGQGAGNVNAGWFTNAGGWIGRLGGNIGSPSGNGAVLGGSVGAGLSGFFSPNANSVCDLSGPFNNLNFAIGWFNVQLNLQWAWGPNAAGRTIHMFSASVPNTGVTWGLSGSGFQTNTTVRGSTCACP